MPVQSISTVVVALLAGVATAMPFSRDLLPTRDSSVTAEDFMGSAINALLSQQNTGGNKFYALQGWNAINFAQGNALVDGVSATANIAYLSSDISQGSNGSARTYFSTQYMNFVQEMSKVMDVNQTSQKELETSMNQQAQSCGPDLVKALTGALQTYIALKGESVVSLSDPGLVQWAQSGYAPYMEAHLECQSATNSYNSAAADYYGDDFALFSAAQNGIIPLTGKAPVSTPGITMSVSPTGGNSSIVPYYSIPVMNGTVSAWIEGQGLTPFSYNSQSSSNESSKSSASDAKTQNIVWNAGSNNSTSNGTSGSNSSSTSYAKATISFGSAANMEILRGSWFDDWKAASALADPADAAAKKGVPAFQKYFGTAEKPGPAAFYNDKALVVFRPSVSIQFASSSAYSDFKKTQNSTDGCVPYLCTSKKSASSQSSTSFHDANHTIVYEDKSDNAYILGYTVASFWNSEKQS